ncbi:YoaK family protein [Kribbella sp. NPDC026611]|uniref:YoaK family protein n=1 Tax=Kribbella sp. NPDC026611 TaxID=3154911 RepID=UPI0033C8C07C
MGLTAATGLIDAVSYLKLGHTFVANMTGNVVFLGFAVDPGSGFKVGPPVAAVVGFVLGSLVGGWAARGLESHARRWLGVVFGVQAEVLVGCGVLFGVDVLHRRDVRRGRDRSADAALDDRLGNRPRRRDRRRIGPDLRPRPRTDRQPPADRELAAN